MPEAHSKKYLARNHGKILYRKGVFSMNKKSQMQYFIQWFQYREGYIKIKYNS